MCIQPMCLCVCVCHPLNMFYVDGSKEQLLRCCMYLPCWSGAAGTGPFRPRRGIWNIGALKYRPMDCCKYLISIVDATRKKKQIVIQRLVAKCLFDREASRASQSLLKLYMHISTQ